VETKDEAQALLDLGIRFGQGYLFARPIDPYAQRR
jgi:EAL domain-containing protein (putative c-di-GMP-specific phosphodiesterase class I)